MKLEIKDFRLQDVDTELQNFTLKETSQFTYTRWLYSIDTINVIQDVNSELVRYTFLLSDRNIYVLPFTKYKEKE